MAGPEQFDDEEMEKLPEDLQYLPDDKQREPDPDIRKMLIESIMKVHGVFTDTPMGTYTHTHVLIFACIFFVALCNQVWSGMPTRETDIFDYERAPQVGERS